MYIQLTFTQCKQLIENGTVLRDFLEAVENQPDFIKKAGEIDSLAEISSINQGGCASGAYMPAVTYHTANETMSECGDEVLQFIEDTYGELPSIPAGESWSGMAVLFLSCAVEGWCSQFDLDGVEY